MKVHLFLIIFSLFIGPTLANEASSLPIIRIESAWIRAAEIGNSAAYMKIVNNGFTSDHLVRAQTDVCNIVELHTHLREGHIFKMRPIEAINIPAKQTVDLKEGELHIMLLNIHRPLKENEKVKLTLTFAEAGQISIIAEVRKNNHECDCSRSIF